MLRVADLGLYAIGARGMPALRRAIASLAVSTAIGLGLLIVAAFTDGWVRGLLWAIALLLDIGGPFVSDSSGWTMHPEHFSERFGLFVLIALGEWVVAIGAGAEGDVTVGVVVAAILGVALAAAVLWWLYFDIVSSIAAGRLAETPPGKQQNDLGRDAWADPDFPMIAGIVLVAFGLESTLAHFDDPLGALPGRRPARRHGVVPAGPRRLPAAGDGHAQHPASHRRPAAARPAARRVTGAGADRRDDDRGLSASAVVAYETWRYDEVRRRVRHHA